MAITFTLAATLEDRAGTLQVQLELLHRSGWRNPSRTSAPIIYFRLSFQALEIRDKRVHVFLLQVHSLHAAELHGGGWGLQQRFELG